MFELYEVGVPSKTQTSVCGIDQLQIFYRIFKNRGDSLKLTKKEQQLLWLNRYCRKRNLYLTIGDYCRILNTTAITLISKTAPGLNAKIENRINEIIEKEFSID